jgi:hypothetical protein
MSEAAQIRAIAPTTPLIEDLARKLTVCRDALKKQEREQRYFADQARLMTVKSEKAGESIAMLQARMDTLRKQIAQEVGQ